MRVRERNEKTQALPLSLRLDPTNAQAWQGERLLKLTPKAFAVLHYLAEHPSQLVTKDELMQTVWADTVVTDGALAASIRELRKALYDDVQAPQYIETVHRRGYRFLLATTPSPVQGSTFKVQRLQSPAPNLQHPTPVLVGREADLTQLHSWLEKALHGDRQLVFVTGEAGIGKTTLLEVFVSGVRGPASHEESQKSKGKSQKPVLSVVEGSKLTDPRSLTPGPWLGRGQCIEHYGAGEAYLPVLEVLGRLCRGAEGEQLIALLHHHAPTWLVQMPGLLDTATLEALQRKTHGATRERMLREFAEALEVITAERLLILVLEDLHWSDPSTLDLLSMLARRTEPARLLILGTYRPIDVIVHDHPLKTVKAELQLHGHCQELALELLSETAIAEYLTARFQVPSPCQACPEPSRRREGQSEGNDRARWQRLAHILHHRTEGNPLFLVAMVEDLITRGVVVQTDTGWDFKDEAVAIEDRIPDSIRQLVTLQSDRLSPDVQQTLEAASIAGMEFSAASVAAALTTETMTIERHCEQLAKHQHFLRRVGVEEWPDGTLAARYSFLHAVYQQLWHERVTPTQMQRHHLQIGQRKELAYGERAGEIAAELAVHFEQGRNYHKAIRYLQQAGQRAVERSANAEAVIYLSRGLEWLKTLPDSPQCTEQELTLRLAMGVPLMATKGYAASEVGATYARALDLGRQLENPFQLYCALDGFLTFCLVRAEHETASQLAEQLLSLARDAQDPGLLVEAHRLLAESFFHRGDLLGAQSHLEQSTAAYDPQQHRTLPFLYGGPDIEVANRAITACVLWYLGYPDQALKSIHAALALAHELAHPLSQAFALDWATALGLYCHDLQGVQEWAEALVTLSGQHEFLHSLVGGKLAQGRVLVEQGQSEEGIAQLRHSLATYQAAGAEIERPTLLAHLAEAYGKVGAIEEGLKVLAEALVIVDKTDERVYEAELYRLRGELTLQRAKQKAKVKGQKSKVTDPRPLTPAPQGEAETCFRTAIDIARKQQAKSWELRATTSLARLWHQQSKTKQAHKLLSEIYNWFTEGFDTKDLQEAKALLEELSQ